jgi:hypothetical protein
MKSVALTADASDIGRKRSTWALLGDRGLLFLRSMWAGSELNGVVAG